MECENQAFISKQDVQRHRRDAMWERIGREDEAESEDETKSGPITEEDIPF
jgi:hypothetical protein